MDRRDRLTHMQTSACDSSWHIPPVYVRYDCKGSSFEQYHGTNKNHINSNFFYLEIF